jgi:type III restriction enzyme
VRSDGAFNDAYVKLLKTDNTNGIKAQLEIHKEGTGGPRAAKLEIISTAARSLPGIR